MRIVSLLPSATEIVAALGLAEKLVGRSHECDWPLGLGHLPVLTQPKMNPLADAATIDRDVRALVEDGVSVYKLDADAIRALQPDFVITQSQCELCAVSLGEVAAALRDWLATTAEADAAQLVSLEPMALADVAVDIDRVGAALGRGRKSRRAECGNGRRFCRLAGANRRFGDAQSVFYGMDGAAYGRRQLDARDHCRRRWRGGAGARGRAFTDRQHGRYCRRRPRCDCCRPVRIFD